MMMLARGQRWLLVTAGVAGHWSRAEALFSSAIPRLKNQVMSHDAVPGTKCYKDLVSMVKT